MDAYSPGARPPRAEGEERRPEQPSSSVGSEAAPGPGPAPPRTPPSLHRQGRAPGARSERSASLRSGQFPKKLYPGPGPSLTRVWVRVPSAGLCRLSQPPLLPQGQGPGSLHPAGAPASEALLEEGARGPGELRCPLWLTRLRKSQARGPGRFSGSKAAWTNSDVLHITGLEPEGQAVIKIQDGTAAVRLAGSDPCGREPGIALPPAPPSRCSPCWSSGRPWSSAVTPAVTSPLHLLLRGLLVLPMSHPRLHYKQLLNLFTALILTMFMVFTSRIF